MTQPPNYETTGQLPQIDAEKILILQRMDDFILTVEQSKELIYTPLELYKKFWFKLQNSKEPNPQQIVFLYHALLRWEKLTHLAKNNAATRQRAYRATKYSSDKRQYTAYLHTDDWERIDKLLVTLKLRLYSENVDGASVKEGINREKELKHIVMLSSQLVAMQGLIIELLAAHGQHSGEASPFATEAGTQAALTALIKLAQQAPVKRVGCLRRAWDAVKSIIGCLYEWLSKQN